MSKILDYIANGLKAMNETLAGKIVAYVANWFRSWNW